MAWNAGYDGTFEETHRRPHEYPSAGPDLHAREYTINDTPPSLSVKLPHERPFVHGSGIDSQRHPPLMLAPNIHSGSIHRTVSTSSSTSSSFWSEAGSTSSDGSSLGYPLTPRDEPYSPSAETLPLSPEIHDDFQYDDHELPIPRRLIAYQPEKEDPVKNYRQHHQHLPKAHAEPITSQHATSMDAAAHHHHSYAHELFDTFRSNCLHYHRQPRRKALCIGINYKGQKALKGCINDAHRMRDFLIEHGNYDKRDIVTLTDGGDGDILPTKRNIIHAMLELVRGATPDDKLFLHYSGHGEQVKDISGDESDGLDEAILPLDFEDSGNIVDDDLNRILVTHLPEGCKLTALVDACHSGTVLDLPYNYHCEGLTDGLEICTENPVNVKASIVSWSGCMDRQASEEVSKGGGRYSGIMTDAFITCLETKLHQTYQELYDNLVEKISFTHTQKPQLGVSQKIDASQVFAF